MLIAIPAIASRAMALVTASSPLAPQVNGPWDATQHARRMEVVETLGLEVLDDHPARVRFVLSFDLSRRERPGDRDRPVEMIRMGGPEARDRPVGLGPRHGRRRVGVDDASQVRVLLVEEQVGRSIRRWPSGTPHRGAVLDGDDHDVVVGQVRVRDAARLDREDAGGPVGDAHVAE